MYEDRPPPPAPKPEDGEYTWNNFAWVKMEPNEEPKTGFEKPKKHHHIEEK